MDLAELLSEAEGRGFTHNFAFDEDRLRCSAHGECVTAQEARIVDSRSVDMGTDPADDATVYFIETNDGIRGYVIVADSFHTDPRKAAFIDRLRASARANGSRRNHRGDS